MSFQPRMYSSSSNLCPSGGAPVPYMFGGNRGGSRALSSTNLRRNGGGNATMRDCMQWPTSTPSTNYANSPYGGARQMSYSNGGGRYQQQQQQPSYGGTASYGQPKAFIMGQGANGSGELKPLQIPCAMGSNAGNMSPMKPITVKVAAPAGAGMDGGPISFTISPDALYGGCQ